jgi:hypothetical protein
MNRSPGGARISSSRARSEPSSCTSSMTSHNRSSSGARSLSRRSTIAQPSRSGAAVNARTSPAPAGVCRSAPSTDSQNRCGSRSSRPTGTNAARPARPAWPIQDRSSIVLPLPAGADTTVTRADPPSRSHSPGRETTPPAPGPATLSAADSELSAGRIAHGRTRHQLEASAGRAASEPAPRPGPSRLRAQVTQIRQPPASVRRVRAGPGCGRTRPPRPGCARRAWRTGCAGGS